MAVFWLMAAIEVSRSSSRRSFEATGSSETERGVDIASAELASSTPSLVSSTGAYYAITADEGNTSCIRYEP